jgi:hypothetical protein
VASDSQSQLHTHRFEEQLEAEAATGSGDRLSYDLLLLQHDALLRQPFAMAAVNARNPIVFFNQKRQLVHANEAALRIIIRQDLKDAIGLRQGEIFGCEHKMSAKPGEIYVCQDCNNMPSLRAALEGRSSREPRSLILHDRPGAPRAVFNISSTPVTVDGEVFAMMIYELSPVMGAL